MNVQTASFGSRFTRGIAVLAIALLAACSLALFAHVGQADAKPYGSLEYKIKTDHVVITGFNDKVETAITIPEKIEGYPVTEIQYGALRKNENWTKVTIEAKIKNIPEVCFYKCTNLKQVILPDTVESIGKVAFYGCTSLDSVTFSAGSKLAEIGDQVFYGCTALESITLPGELTALGKEVFAYCQLLASIDVPAGVLTIPEGAFKGCKALSNVTLHDGLKTIGGTAFDDCKALTTLAIPESVTTIGEEAFRYAGLTSTNLPKGLTTLGEGAFSYCGKLADIGSIPTTLTNIGPYAFSNCAFEYMAVPDTITALPVGMFFACSKMKSISLPDTLTSIDKYALASCKSLEYLRVPKGVTLIGNYALQKLDAAKMVYFENGDKNWVGAFVFGEKDYYKDKSLTVVCAVGTANAPCKTEVEALGASFKTIADTGSYTVTHDANGGSGTMANVVLPKGFAYALPLCKFTKAAADFKVWEVSAKEYQPGQAAPATSSNMTAKATWDDWSESGYEVRFKPNGGSGTMETLTVKKKTAFTLPVCTFTAPEGKTFSYWTINDGYADIPYREGAVCGMNTRAGSGYAFLNVKAQWVGEYTVTFDAMGGTVAPGTMKTNGNGRLESWPTATKDGCVLDCWSTTEDSGGMVTLGRVYTADTTLHAIWEPAPEEEGGSSGGSSGGGSSGGGSSGGESGGGSGGGLTPGIIDDGGSGGGSSPAVETVTMRRLYNPYSYEHFYTAKEDERDNLVSLGWVDEGVGWVAPATSDTPVYRLYNPNNGGDHHYTKDAVERDALIEAGWVDEDIGWYSAAETGAPVYREYNPNEPVRNHNYTQDKEEHDGLVAMGWDDEDIAWYGVK